MAKNNKEIKEIINVLLSIGWEVRLTKKNHYWCIPPDGKSTPILIASSPKTDRSLKTTKVRLKNEYDVDVDNM
jgi:hypothetical protein